MVDNNPDDLLRKLKTLSKREAQVLVLRCGGMTYAAIGKALSIAEPTVKTNIGRIYIKLGLDVLEPSQRIKVLYDTVCPLLKARKPAGEKGDTKPEDFVEGEVVPESEEEPVPEKIMDMVENDGKAMVPWRPAPLVAPLPPRRTRPPIWPVVLVLGVVLGICLGAGVVYLILRPPVGPLPFIPQPTVTLLPPTAFSADTPLPSPTAEIPTQTPFVVTATLPAATAVPTLPPPAALSLPFTDDFDNGASPDWQPVTTEGTWRVINGSYTETGETTGIWSYTMVGDPNWQDYTVDVDYSQLKDQVAGVAIVVRSGATNDLHLAFIIYNYQASWRIWKDGRWQILVTSDSAPNVQGHIKVVVAGSTFTASANGISPLVITDTSTSSGKVGLGVRCRSVDSCPSFDNFSVK